MDLFPSIDVTSSTLGESPLQTGSSAQVYISDVRLVVPNCAMKVARPGYETALYNEYRCAMAVPPHPNVLRPLGAAKDDFTETATHLALPLCVGGDLHSFAAMFSSEAQLIPVQRVLPLLNQILAGLAHIHLHGLVHRDLKLENILFADSDCTIPVIADMGLSAPRGDLMHGLTGTLGYAPPESYMLGCNAAAARAGAPSLPSFDIWSLCIIAVMLLTGQNLLGIMLILQQNQLEDRLLQRVDAELAHALCRGLNIAAAERITLLELQTAFLRALTRMQASSDQPLRQGSVTEVAAPSPHAAPLPDAAAGALDPPRQLSECTSSPSEDSTEFELSHPPSFASGRPAPPALDNSTAEDLATRLSLSRPLRITAEQEQPSELSGQATPEVADDSAVPSALAPSACSGAVPPNWPGAAFAHGRGSLPLLSPSAAVADILRANSEDCPSGCRDRENRWKTAEESRPQAAVQPLPTTATCAKPVPALVTMPSLPPVRTSAPGAAEPPALDLAVEDGGTGCSVLAMSPGPSPRPSPRSSLLRRMREFMKSPMFSRKGDAQSLSPAGASPGRWGAFRSPRKAPKLNVSVMLQSMRGRMRRDSYVAM